MKTCLQEDRFFSMTWNYLNEYIPSQHRDSPQTQKSYEDALTIFRRYITDELHISIEAFRFQDLTYDFMLDYRDYLINKQYKPRTINHRITVIIAYMKYVAMRKSSIMQLYLNISDVPQVKVPNKIREIIEEKASLKSLFEAPGNSNKHIRDQLILVLLYDTAIRVGELISMNLSDINLNCKDPFIRIHGKGDKERFVALSDKTIPLVKQYIKIFHKDRKDSNVPFIYTVNKGILGRMTERNAERIVRKYGEIVRKQDNNMPENVYPHMLRRTRITGWYRDGVPIETIAVAVGHSDAKTTRKSYAIPSVQQLKKDLESGSDIEPVVNETEEKPLWTNDTELAKLCGVR